MPVKIQFKLVLPHLVAILSFLILAFAYFPEVLDGKQLGGHDNANIRGMSKEIMEYNEASDDIALWTGRMFSGMPAYMIHVPYQGNMFRYLDWTLQVGPRPVSFLFLYLIGFYILMISLRINPWLALAGAIAFAFSSYNFVIVAAGHNSKAIAIAYMAPVLAGIFISFRGKRLWGAALTALALSLLIRANHPQITYYTLLMVVIYGAFQLYYAIRDKKLKDFALTVGILVLSAGLGAASNTDRLWTAMEYGKYTMRSPSELSAGEEDKTSGLTKSYATAWSYGIDETFSLLIPGFKGGSSDGSLTENSATYELFARNNPQQAAEVIKHLPLYWGPQSSTQGNVYVGAIVVFLFILGMFLVDPRLKWWLFASAVLGILLSWGSHFMWLTDLFMEYVPGYNKFRTVSMTLVIPALAMPILGIFALNKILARKVETKKLFYALKWSLGIAGGLSLIFVLLPDLAGNFVSARDSSYQQALADALQADRRHLLRTDALRSLIFILLAAGMILLYWKEKINQKLAIALVAVLFLADMWPINKRYLNKEHFSPKRQAENPFTPSAADQFILNQPGENKRVLNLTVALFQDASTSYFHPSLGGYHGAKLRRYQDLIEHGLSDEINQLYESLRSQDFTLIDSTLVNSRVFNMLNTTYIILNPENQPLVNPYARGNAWFTNQLLYVENADEEMAALAGLDLDREASIDRRFEDRLAFSSFEPDSASSIILTSYSPNRMTYACRTETDQLAVFSEIYYEKGWQAYLDGEKVDHIRVNYLLRGMPVPSGEHEIVFEFRPRSYFLGTTVSKTTSLILLLLLAGSIYYEWRRSTKPEEEPAEA